ncbi:TetR/AcrR family transcriptional regulator [Nocardioides hankookensis]|uniref:Helix-turn-helix domain-containing protein n=1 Tax=Nocardioides hankookensis TaxID=443157 RepID=A0ABW1LJZ7_9ACTN
MGRWEPNARGRLEVAALELYAERGYDQTTVAAIAERAGLSERTFFRHFTDKREVLFGSGMVLEEMLTDSVAGGAAEASPYDLVAAALEQAAELLDGRRPIVTRRQAVIDAHPELRERELGKMTSWADALMTALMARGVEERLACLVAQTGIAVFRVSFEGWARGGATEELPAIVHTSFADLRSATVTPSR